MQLIPEKLIYPRKPKAGDTKSTKERSGKAKVIKLPSYLRLIDRRYERYGATLCPSPFFVSFVFFVDSSLIMPLGTNRQFIKHSMLGNAVMLGIINRAQIQAIRRCRDTAQFAVFNLKQLLRPAFILLSSPYVH